MRTPLSRVSRRGRVTIVVLTVLFLLFTLFDRVVDLWTDWLWFDEVEYTEVFGGVLTARLVLFAVFGVGMALVVAANLYLAYRVRPLLRPHSPERHALDRYRMLVGPGIHIWITAVAVLAGLFAGVAAQARWQEWMLFANSQPFGVVDPEFGVDIGFYVFEYPFWRYLVGVGFTATVLSVLGALAVHYLFGGVRLQGAGERMSTAARAHLTTLVAFFVLLKAVAYFLDRRGLLLAKNNVGKTDLYGGFYTDINALLPAKEILAYLSIVVAVAILVFSNVWARNLLWPGVALGMLVISAVLVGGIYPAAVQSFTVTPSELAKEPPYIARSIEATRHAFGLDGAEKVDYASDNTEPPANLATDPTTVPHIRLLDPSVVSATFTQMQQLRGFYSYSERLDIDRYRVDDKVQDYVVGAREIDYNRLASDNWQNRHTVFTHGYGFTAAPANKTVCDGRPYFVSGFMTDSSGQEQQPTGQGCVSSTDLIPTTQPRIYYGERMDGYAIVGRAAADGPGAEFDRPTASGDQYFTYDGAGGIPVGSYGRRLLYALQLREANFLLSSVFNDNSKLLYVREPHERVKKVAPFLRTDGDAYPAVIDGRIVWIIDAYTTASTYPYAQRIDLRAATTDADTGAGTIPQANEEINYMRNSVKATVDAYDGTVKLYSFDDTDPVLKAWNKAFGGTLVEPSDSVPPELAEHFRYPEDLFKVQRDLWRSFHVDNANEFYSGQDFWQVPDDPTSDGTEEQPPYYLLGKFEGQSELTFQLTATLTPKNRENLAAFMTASYRDGKPRLQIFGLPNDTPIFGPVQAHSVMTIPEEIQQQLNLLTGPQREFVFGNLLSLPVGGGMLYVEPIYTRVKAANGYPLMQKVLLSYGNRVAFADTLDKGLEQLVAQAGKPETVAPPATGQPPANGGTQPPADGAVAAAVKRIQKAIADLRAAQQSGDFEAQGRALKELDEAMKAYDEAVKAASAAPAASPSPAPGSSPGGSPSPPQPSPTS